MGTSSNYVQSLLGLLSCKETPAWCCIKPYSGLWLYCYLYFTYLFSSVAKLSLWFCNSGACWND